MLVELCGSFFVKRHTIQEEGFQHGVQQQEQQLHASGTLCNQERSRLNVFEFDPFVIFPQVKKIEKFWLYYYREDRKNILTRRSKMCRIALLASGAVAAMPGSKKCIDVLN